MKNFLRVLRVARRYWAWVVVSVVAMMLTASATVFAFNLVRPLYDEVLGRPAVSSAEKPGVRVPRTGFVRELDRLAAAARKKLAGIAGGDRRTVLLLVLAAIAVKNISTFMARYAVAKLGLATIRDLRNRLYDALLRQSPRYFQSKSAGVLVARVVNDVRLIQEALGERFGDLLQDSLTVVVLLVYVFSLNFWLALATLVLAPVLIAPVIHFSRRLRRRSRQSQERMGDLTSVLDETIKGIRVVQAFGMEDFVRRRFRRATHRHFWASLKARAIQAANAPVMEIVGTAGAVALFGYASVQISAGRMTLGDFSAFLLGIYGTYNPIKRLNKFNLALQQAEVASQRVFEVVDAPVEVADRPGAEELADVGDGVRLERVWFAYEDEQWVLRDFSLEIPRGATVALVGPSGAGKSTIAHLIPRFWDVQRGAVRVGGHDVRDVTLESLRRRIGLVTQETVLFNDTVRANIAFGREDIPLERVVEAAEAAYAHDFIARLPEGYDTVIGEGGSRLSGGERQRLAIARALLKDPPILILDEATSQLDPEAERLVQRALENLMRGRTTLVIAHRLSTVRRADRIVVLDGGCIVESGTHEELLAGEGMYARLVRLQELA